MKRVVRLLIPIVTSMAFVVSCGKLTEDVANVSSKPGTFDWASSIKSSAGLYSSDGTFSLDWTVPAGAQSYEVEIYESSGCTGSPTKRSAINSPPTSLRLSGTAKTYSLKIIAKGKDDSASTECSPPLRLDTQAPTVVTYSAPSGNTATGSSSYTFSWSTSDVGPAGLRTTDTYRVEKFANGTCSGSPTASSYQTASTFDYTGLSTGGVYSIRVTAYDAASNNSSPTCSATVTYSTVPVLTDLADRTFSASYLNQSNAISLDVNNTNTGDDTGMTYVCYFDQSVDGVVGAGAACSFLQGFTSFNTATGVLAWTPPTTTYGPYEIRITGTNAFGSDDEIVVVHIREGFLTTNLVSYWDPLFSTGTNLQDLWNTNNGTLTNFSSALSNYATNVLADGPIGYWRLNEASGTTAADSSGNARNSTYYNSPVFDQLGPLYGTWYGALQIDATLNQHVRMAANAAFDFSGPFTLEGWIYYTSGDGALIAKGYNPGYMLWAVSNSVRFYINGASRASVSITPNTWTHIAATWDGATARIYKNGALANSGAYATAPNSATYELVFGYYSSTSYDFTGKMDEIAIYNKALLPSQIFNHYDSATRQNGWLNDLVRRLDFDGVDDHVNFGTTLNANTNFTLETWLKPASQGLPNRVIATNGDGSNKGISLRTSGGDGRVSLGLGTAKSYVEEIMADSPISYWRLGETAGVTAYDSSENGYHGSYLNGVELGQTHTPSWGSSDKAARFNFGGPVNQKVQMNAPLLSGTGDLTIEAWIYRTATGMTHFIAGNYGLGNVGGVEFYIRNNDKLALYIGAYAESVSTFSANTWYHVAAVRSAGTVTLYVNGVNETDTALANAITTSLNFSIGNGPDYTSERFNGLIDEVAVYDKALSAARILAHYNARTVLNCQSQAGLPVSIWSHVASVFDATGPTLKLYLNGQQECAFTDAGAVFTGSTNALRIGTDAAGSSGWPGSLGAALAYSSALSTTQIRSNLLATQTRFSDLPRSISNLAFWIKADSMSVPDGTPVNSWMDSSGNAVSISQPTSTKQPIYKTNTLNGMPVIRFDGVDDFLDLGTAIGKPANYTIFLVLASSDIANRRSAFGSCDAAGSVNACNTFHESKAYNSATNGVTGYFISTGAAYSHGYTVNPVFSNGTFIQLTSQYASGDNAGKIFVNGASQALVNATTAATSNSGAAQKFSIGRPGDYNGLYWQGDIAEIIVYTRSLTDAERRRVEAYLNTRYNLW